jgi:succinate dehydrogenase / fumarate reductase cytochrome b subunit
MGGIKALGEVEHNGVILHNLYAEMDLVFTNPYIVILYVLACGSLGYHLAHGFQSAFKTIGVHNKKYHTMLTSIGYGFSVFIALLFAIMPISFYFDWIK